MKEKNIQRANAVCNWLEKYRACISRIDSISSIETKQIDVDVKLKDKNDIYTVSFELGDEYIKWSLNREKMRLQGRILELEAELRKL